ncbi:hypothetical protein D3C85_400690 [compost metagenome]
MHYHFRYHEHHGERQTASSSREGFFFTEQFIDPPHQCKHRGVCVGDRYRFTADRWEGVDRRRQALGQEERFEHQLVFFQRLQYVAGSSDDLVIVIHVLLFHFLHLATSNFLVADKGSQQLSVTIDFVVFGVSQHVGSWVAHSRELEQELTDWFLVKQVKVVHVAHVHNGGALYRGHVGDHYPDLVQLRSLLPIVAARFPNHLHYLIRRWIAQTVLLNCFLNQLKRSKVYQTNQVGLNHFWCVIVAVASDELLVRSVRIRGCTATGRGQ